MTYRFFVETFLLSGGCGSCSSCYCFISLWAAFSECTRRAFLRNIVCDLASCFNTNSWLSQMSNIPWPHSHLSYFKILLWPGDIASPSSNLLHPFCRNSTRKEAVKMNQCVTVILTKLPYKTPFSTSRSFLEFFYIFSGDSKPRISVVQPQLHCVHLPSLPHDVVHQRLEIWWASVIFLLMATMSTL